MQLLLRDRASNDDAGELTRKPGNKGGRGGGGKGEGMNCGFHRMRERVCKREGGGGGRGREEGGREKVRGIGEGEGGDDEWIMAVTISGWCHLATQFSIDPNLSVSM